MGDQGKVRRQEITLGLVEGSRKVRKRTREEVGSNRLKKIC